MKTVDLSYIAGFLDGDGCIMLQLVFRNSYKLGYQIRASIVFYQKTQHKDFLFWLKEQLQIGYVRDRNDGMSEYTIVGTESVKKILKKFLPYLRLKRKQADLAISVLNEMPRSGRQMVVKDLLRLSKEVDKFLLLNYSKKRTNTSIVVEQFLRSRNLLDPVETEA